MPIITMTMMMALEMKKTGLLRVEVWGLMPMRKSCILARANCGEMGAGQTTPRAYRLRARARRAIRPAK